MKSKQIALVSFFISCDIDEEWERLEIDLNVYKMV